MSNSIARASYWLVRLLKMLIKETLTKNQVGWELHRGGQLTRALDQVTSLQFCNCCHNQNKTQNKVNPLEEVTCVALRRSLLLCGTEGGRILGFNCSGD